MGIHECDSSNRRDLPVLLAGTSVTATSGLLALSGWRQRTRARPWSCPSRRLRRRLLACHRGIVDRTQVRRFHKAGQVYEPGRADSGCVRHAGAIPDADGLIRPQCPALQVPRFFDLAAGRRPFVTQVSFGTLDPAASICRPSMTFKLSLFPYHTADRCPFGLGASEPAHQ